MSLNMEGGFEVTKTLGEGSNKFEGFGTKRSAYTDINLRHLTGYDFF